MKLWDDDMEALRPKLREETASFVATMPWQERNSGTETPAERVATLRRTEFVGPPSDRAVDRTIAGPAGPLRLRVFVPDDPVGVMLHIHGGAWLAGTPETTDLLNQAICDTCRVAVASVDYRLAPEDPYPAGPDDCEAAAVWLLEHAGSEFGSERLLIGGESAGAHLSAVTLLRMKEKHHAAGSFAGALLAFGAFDLSRTPSQRGVGIRPEDDILDDTGFPIDMFLPGMAAEDRRRPDVSPLYGDLAGLGPALFSVGTNDHLVDDTLFMATRWHLAGNDMELLVYPEAPHGCFALPSVAAHYFPRMFAFIDRCLQPA